MKGVGFWRMILPLCCCCKSYPSMHLVGGKICDKGRTSQQLRGSILQDKHMFMVVIQSIYINTNISFFPICDVIISYISIPC